MVQLHELTLGDSVDNLLVEIHSVDGVDPESKPNDPAYKATVRDSTGYATLVYRSSNSKSKQATITLKQGQPYLISGTSW